ncbi:MAG TPA: ABC transporter substrate-binding protein [Candidatus Methylomirabilis sp.]|nr:ABC transporter substrate-binding protein [Candidatus Methylomirabilis sp.]
MRAAARTPMFLAVPAVILALFASWSGTALGAGKTLRIAMVLWRGPTEAEKGFKDGLKELGYSVEYTDMNAGQDRAELGRLLRETLKPRLETFDYVYTYGTTVTLGAKSIVQDKVPVIFNIVNDPVGAGIVESMERSGGNIAGVSNEVPLLLQLKTALAVFPVKRLGLLFNPREKNSALIRDKIMAAAPSLGIEVVDLRSPPALDALQDNLHKLRDKSIAVDAVYLPPDSFLVSNATEIGAALRDAQVKSIAALEPFIDQGALLGVVPDYYQLGKAAAAIVQRHQEGQRLQDIPVQTDRDPGLKINATTSRVLKVTIPEAMKKRATFVE